jgi:hypothetical protein
MNKSNKIIKRIKPKTSFNVRVDVIVDYGEWTESDFVDITEGDLWGIVRQKLKQKHPDSLVNYCIPSGAVEIITRESHFRYATPYESHGDLLNDRRGRFIY